MYYFKVFYQPFTLLIGIVMIWRWYWVNRPAALTQVKFSAILAEIVC